MVFPIIPVVLWATLAASGGGLAWYHSLPQKEKERANKKALAATGRSIEWWNSLPEEKRRQIVKEIAAIACELFNKNISGKSGAEELTEDEWVLVGSTLRDRNLL